ncbi:MAG: hypothetical protein HC915_21450 [Anaerolineae bacterium]|nr:hypothetical protein [Anaerolineae bacterium]
MGPATVAAAWQAGERWRLVCEAWRAGDLLVARVAPQRLPLEDPLANLPSTASALTLETDILDRLTLIEGPAGPRTTAYGMLADAINIARGRRE